MNVTVYLNGKRVAKEELKNIEIKSETVKRILAQKLSSSSDNHENDNDTKPEQKN